MKERVPFLEPNDDWATKLLFSSCTHCKMLSMGGATICRRCHESTSEVYTLTAIALISHQLQPSEISPANYRLVQ